MLVGRTEPTQGCDDAAQPDFRPVHVIHSRLTKERRSTPNIEHWTLDATPRADKDKQKIRSTSEHANADSG